MDQLNVHRSNKVSNLAKVLGIELIFNAAYSPDYNPIERVFSQAKLLIKKERLRAIRNNKGPNDEAIIEAAF